MTVLVDGSSPAPLSSSGASTDSAAFTPPSNCLLLAAGQADANNGNNTELLTPSDSASGAWNTAVVRNGSGGAVAGFYWRLVGTSPGSMTVSLADSQGSVAKRLVPLVITGADQTSPIGATVAAATQSVSYTSTRAGSLAFSCGIGSNGTVTATTGTLYDETGGFDGGDAVWTVKGTPVGSAGSTVTLAITGSTVQHHVMVEILPPSTGGGPAAPIVVTPASAYATRPAPALLQRSTLQDPPVLTTPGPLVVTGTRPVLIPRPVVIRGTLQDPPVLTTPQPVVVGPPHRPVPVPPVALLRATLADPPVLTTPAPVVVTGVARLFPGQAWTSRSSLADAVVVAGPTARAVVVGPPYQPVPIPPAALLRSTLTDPPVLTTTQPYVVSQAARTVFGAVLTLRSTLADVDHGTAPLVVTPTPKAAPVPPVYLLRGTLTDPIPQTTPGPYVVSATTRTVVNPVLLIAAPAPPIVAASSAAPKPYVITSQPALARTSAILLAAPRTAAGPPPLASGYLSSSSSSHSQALSTSTGALSSTTSSGRLTSSSGGD